jgi:hypothetical protein
VTANEAVAVAAKAGVETRPDASKTKANVRDAHFMNLTLLVTGKDDFSNLSASSWKTLEIGKV